VQYSARNIEIDTEAIGTRGSLNLTPEEIESLDRNGDEGKLTVSYLFRFGDNNNYVFRPLLGGKSFDADGDAQDYDSTYVQLTYSYFREKWIFVTNANPVYGVKQDQDISVCRCQYFLPSAL